MTYQPPAMVYIEHFNIHHIEPYLIFVIIFTLTNVESWKFYTRKVRKFTTNLPRDKTAQINQILCLTDILYTVRELNISLSVELHTECKILH